MDRSVPVSGHVFRVEDARGPVWRAKYRLPDGRHVQKKIGPAWTGRGRPAEGHARSNLFGPICWIQMESGLARTRLRQHLLDAAPPPGSKVRYRRVPAGALEAARDGGTGV